MSDIDALSRRRMLALAAAVPFAAAPFRAFAQAGLRFRAIQFDNAPMAVKGVRPLIDLFARVTPPAVARAFAGTIVPGDRSAPVLRVILDSASFGSSSSGDDTLSGATDYLVGSGEVIAPSGQVIARYPIQAEMAAPRPDYAPSQANYTLRAELVAQNFALWLRRYVGG